MFFLPTQSQNKNNYLGEITLLLLRLWLAQEFIYAAIRKLSGGVIAPDWFAGLEFPWPFNQFTSNFNWSLVSLTELIVGIMLLVGLFTRLSSVVLLIVTVVAIYSVHFDLGWMGWDQIETDDGQGFKVPLMIGLMLITLLGMGAGKISIDYLLSLRKTNSDSTASS